MKTPAIMFQGTGSSVGKSVLVAGLGRAFTRKGLKVVPFKPQNMSNNAAVTFDGGEIGRAQALQARACKVKPSVHMNPVLLKPHSTTGSQVVVQGKIWGEAQAREYQTMKPRLMAYVMDSFGQVSSQADLVLVEGAGSASEINLRSGDIANMGFATQGDVNVILVGDIDRGGVIASLVGTHTVLAEEDKRRIKGFVVNKMRGDISLFAEGMHSITSYTGWNALGLVPAYAPLHHLPAEDSMDIAERIGWYGRNRKSAARKLEIIVPLLPGLANFDDFDPLLYEDSVQVNFLHEGMEFPQADVVILPGSKTTGYDLSILRQRGWDKAIRAHYQSGGMVFGICGGYQMLGKTLSDPYGVEGKAGMVEEGIGLLDVETTLSRTKTLRDVTAQLLTPLSAAVFKAYEMHMGVTVGPDTLNPFAALPGDKRDGAWSGCGRVGGCYLHALFADTAVRQALLYYWDDKKNFYSKSHFNYNTMMEKVIEGWATHLEQHMDLDQIWSLAQRNG